MTYQAIYLYQIDGIVYIRSVGSSVAIRHFF